MIKRFEVGKWYRYVGKNLGIVPSFYAMKAVDGNPHLCVRVWDGGDRCSFLDCWDAYISIDPHSDNSWLSFGRHIMDGFIECGDSGLVKEALEDILNTI